MDLNKLKQEAEEYTEGMAKYYASTHEDYIPSQFEKYLRNAYIASAEPREKRIAELEAQIEILERRIIRAKECMKKLLFIINSEPSNYNCKGLVKDADDFIHNRTCNIRKSGNYCITNEPCIMCDK